ncbi:DUF3829 domain-containing protein [Affinibrenneria salicis]|nr:DUF3829 domain-containing protein [Affinibrenneria salicis]
MGLKKKSALLASAVAIASALFITGCDNSGDNSAKNEQTEQQLVQQREIAKYNAYIDTANAFRDDLASELENHIDYMQNDAKKEDYEGYRVIGATDITRMSDDIDKAAAMSPVMDDLDAPAKAFSSALHNIQPLITELGDYVDAKGMLADKGEKARAKEKEYVALMTELINAQNKFTDAIEKRNEENLRTTMEKADKDSPEYYRAAVALYSRQVTVDAHKFYEALYANTPDKEINNDFKENIDKLAGLTQGCPAAKSEINELVANGRNAINKAQKGGYAIEGTNEVAKRVLEFSIRQNIRTDQQRFELDYSRLIGAINRPAGCGKQ